MLSGKQILAEMAAGRIVIEPFRESAVGSNSVNLRLSQVMLAYTLDEREWVTTYSDGLCLRGVLDMARDNAVRLITIPPEGIVLVPGKLYLGSTMEYTETRGFVPTIETRSSVARLGLSCHLSAGYGDSGFCGTFTLEITVVHPLRVYAGVEIVQIAYARLDGEETTYKGKYNGQRGPVPSRLWKEFQ